MTANTNASMKTVRIALQNADDDDDTVTYASVPPLKKAMIPTLTKAELPVFTNVVIPTKAITYVSEQITLQNVEE